MRNKPSHNVTRSNHSRSPSYISGDGTLRSAYNEGFLESFSGTDSVRSATIRRGGNGGRPRSSIQIFEQGPIPGVPPPEVIPIAMPTPPTSRSKDQVTNGTISNRKSHEKETEDGGPYKLPLVAQLSKKLESEQIGQSVKYKTTDDAIKKGKNVK